MAATDFPFMEERRLTEEQRTETVKVLLAQGFSIGDIHLMAPNLLAAEPEAAATVALPIRTTCGT